MPPLDYLNFDLLLGKLSVKPADEIPYNITINAARVLLTLAVLLCAPSITIHNDLFGPHNDSAPHS